LIQALLDRPDIYLDEIQLELCVCCVCAIHLWVCRRCRALRTSRWDYKSGSKSAGAGLVVLKHNWLHPNFTLASAAPARSVHTSYSNKQRNMHHGVCSNHSSVQSHDTWL